MTVAEGLRRDIAQQLHGTVQNKLIVLQQMIGRLKINSELEPISVNLSELNDILTDVAGFSAVRTAKRIVAAAREAGARMV